MKVRITSLPATTFERAKSELDLSNFQLGELYEVDATAAAYLVACHFAVYEMRSVDRPHMPVRADRRHAGRVL